MVDLMLAALMVGRLRYLSGHDSPASSLGTFVNRLIRLTLGTAALTAAIDVTVAGLVIVRSKVRWPRASIQTQLRRSI